MNNLYFHIGCTYSKEPILQRLIDAGLKLVVIDDIGIKPSNQGIIYLCVFDKNYQQIKKTILDVLESEQTSIQNSHFFTLAEGSVDLLNQLLKDFKKPPISNYSGTLRDKYWVRKSLEINRIEKLPFHYLAKNPAEIPNPSKQNFPLIVKPIGSMASRNVFKVSDHDELRKACLEIFTKNKTFVTVDHGEIILEEVYNQLPYAVIESCLKGEKLSFETLILNKEIKFTAVTSKFDYENDFFYERADIVDPNFFNKNENEKLNEYIKLIVDALEINSAILHVEVFFNKENQSFHLIEVNFRMGGDNIHELVTRTYNFDIVLEFLKGLSENSISNPINNPSLAWIAFYFMTGQSGEFKSKTNWAFENKIEWDYSDGDKISKFSTSKFYKLGTVMFSCEKNQIETRLNQLFNEPYLYYSLKGSETESSWSQKNIKKSAKDASKFLKIGISIIYITACVLGGVYLYQSFKEQTRLISETLSKTLAYHLANGEIYYVAKIVNNFQNGQTYSRIIVADKNNKVIYSTSSNSNISLSLYQEVIDPKKYNEFIPIKVDGIEIGFLAYDFSYRNVLAQFAVGFLLISALLAGLYFLIVKYLFNRLAITAQNETDEFISIVNQLNVDLIKFHEKNTSVSLEKYDQLLKSSDSELHILTDLRLSLRKLVGVLKDLRNGIIEKNQLASLLDESTKQLIKATTQTEIAKVAAQLSHDIRSPLAALKVVLDMGAGKMDKDQAKLLTMSIDRITDIANTILPKENRLQNSTKEIEPAFIWMLVDQIISEKRVEYKNLNNVSIAVEIEGSPFDLNAHCNPADFMRSISNIINNSVEAKLPDRALNIQLNLKENNDHLLLSIVDNGKGIDSAVISKVFDESFSHEKAQGTGLGLFQVKQAVESWGGSIQAESQVNVGTKISIQLKKSNKPEWLTDSVQVKNINSIIVLDDEEYVFKIIEDKFEKYCSNIQYFKRIDEFEDKLKTFEHSLLFIDHDLKQNQTGLDLVKKHQLQDFSILLTGNYDDKQVQQKALDNNIKILPKPLINDIPIIT